MDKKLELKLEESKMNNLTEKMQKTITDLKTKNSGLRTNRANPNMIKNIQVNYYGSMVPLHQVASISTPEPTQFLLNIFDQAATKDIEKALMSSTLGLNPQTDGLTIRIILPELTQERRATLVKVLKQNGEDAKIAIRNIRRDQMDIIKNEEKSKEISEDDSRKQQDQIQSSTDEFIKNIDSIIKAKEIEITTI